MDQNYQGARHYRLFCTVMLTVLAVIALLPIILIVIASVTDEKALISNGYTYFPAALSTDSYYYMIRQSSMIVRAYLVSILTTLVGTVGGLVFTTMLAYPLSRATFRFKNAISFFVFFTMLFNGGIAASYIMWTTIFSIRNTFWALVVPNYLVTAFNVFLIRNYYSTSVPPALIESAQIDGGNEFIIFLRIMLPLSVPVVATVSLFSALTYWNDWVNCLYYVTDPTLFGIQNLLIRIMNNIQFLKSSSNAALLGTQAVDLPGTSVRMAMAVIGMLPVLVIFPFVQKYFIKGVVLGAVKG